MAALLAWIFGLPKDDSDVTFLDTCLQVHGDIDQGAKEVDCISTKDLLNSKILGFFSQFGKSEKVWKVSKLSLCHPPSTSASIIGARGHLPYGKQPK